MVLSRWWMRVICIDDVRYDLETAWDDSEAEVGVPLKDVGESL